MPLLVKFILVALIAYMAGSTITPLLWGKVLAEESKQVLTPYAVTSAALLIAAVGYAASQFRRRD